MHRRLAPPQRVGAPPPTGNPGSATGHDTFSWTQNEKGAYIKGGDILRRNTIKKL